MQVLAFIPNPETALLIIASALSVLTAGVVIHFARHDSPSRRSPSKSWLLED